MHEADHVRSCEPEHFDRRPGWEAHDVLRQQQLVEAFVAKTAADLRGPKGQIAAAHLAHAHGIDVAQGGDLPLGLYVSTDHIHAHLEELGFAEEEIAAAKVTRDSRLPGRTLVFWRDRFGRVESIVGLDTSYGGQHRRSIHWRRPGESSLFGLDVALRCSSAGRQELVLVDGLLEVVALHAVGVANVASVGPPGKPLEPDHWRTLEEAGVERLTLALADDECGQQRTLDAIDTHDAAKSSIRLFAVPDGLRGRARHLATFAHLHGAGQVRQLLGERHHAFRHAAVAMIRRHQSGTRWTDAGLVALVEEAIAFDRDHFSPERAWELERFFWPPVLQACGASWEAMQARLSRPMGAIHGTSDSIAGVSRVFPEQQRPAAESNEQRFDLSAVNAVLLALAEESIADDPLIVIDEEDEQPADEDREPVSLALESISLFVAPDEEDTVLEPDEPADAQPIDLTEVRALAYRLWEIAGRPVGREQQFWFDAEAILRGAASRARAAA